MMTSRFSVSLAALLLLSFGSAAGATMLPAESAQNPLPAQSPAQSQTQTTPVFSLGTISIAPSPQNFASPSLTGGSSRKSRSSGSHHAAHNSRSVTQPVPLRTYSRI